MTSVSETLGIMFAQFCTGTMGSVWLGCIIRTSSTVSLSGLVVKYDLLIDSLE